jgi:hypothetical protein
MVFTSTHIVFFYFLDPIRTIINQMFAYQLLMMDVLFENKIKILGQPPIASS